MASRRLDWSDRGALIAGGVTIAFLAILYPIVADAAARPLAVFVLPCLLTAVIGGWRPTVVIGTASLIVAVILGLLGPLETSALIARWVVIAAGTGMGAVGASLREGQAGQVAELDETVGLLAAFERALAPPPAPPEGFVAVARYHPAEARMQLGGDFLEAIAVGEGRMGLLIGDVCGHGPREAAFGAALRAGWKSIALSQRRDPVEWVEALHAAFFRDGRIDTYVTLCTGYIDIETRGMRFVNAGHPPPVSLTSPATLLDIAPCKPLGFDFAQGWTAQDLPWTDAPLLLYTDGLVENPRLHGPAQRWLEPGLLRWLDAHAAEVRRPAFLDSLMEAATEGRDLRDDIALLLVSADTGGAR